MIPLTETPSKSILLYFLAMKVAFWYIPICQSITFIKETDSKLGCKCACLFIRLDPVHHSKVMTSKGLNKLLPKSMSLQTVWVREQMEETKIYSWIHLVLKSFDSLNGFPKTGTSSMGLDVRVLTVTYFGSNDFLHNPLGVAFKMGKDWTILSRLLQVVNSMLKE
jgi:hypothetical protein